MKLAVPAKVWRIAIEGSGVPAEEAWPDPRFRAIGRGGQYVYEVTPQQRELIVSHVAMLYMPGASGDPEYSGDMSAIKGWLGKVAADERT